VACSVIDPNLKVTTLPPPSQMVNIARRAPGSADMRAALAALYWANGDVTRAEDSWDFVCTQISVSIALKVLNICMFLCF
jgi:hypothetical protein